MQYLSVNTIKEDFSKTSIIINFEFNMNENTFNKLSSQNSYFPDMKSNTFYKSSDDFFNRDFFDDYFKKIFNMDNKIIPEFYNMLKNFKKIIENFSVSKISLYTYIMSVEKLRNQWNDKYKDYEIGGITENSIVITYSGIRRK